MAKDKKSPAYLFPAMYYHPKSGDYVICKSKAEVPEGFVDSPKKVKGFDKYSTEAPNKASIRTTRVADEITLKSLELTRPDAIKLLKEAKIEHKGNATNAELAALIAEHFDDEDNEDDNSE